MWRWDQQETLGVNVPIIPMGWEAFQFPLRFPGQFADKETNLITTTSGITTPGLEGISRAIRWTDGGLTSTAMQTQIPQTCRRVWAKPLPA